MTTNTAYTRVKACLTAITKVQERLKHFREVAKRYPSIVYVLLICTDDISSAYEYNIERIKPFFVDGVTPWYRLLALRSQIYSQYKKCTIPPPKMACECNIERIKPVFVDGVTPWYTLLALRSQIYSQYQKCTLPPPKMRASTT